MQYVHEIVANEIDFASKEETEKLLYDFEKVLKFLTLQKFDQVEALDKCIAHCDKCLADIKEEKKKLHEGDKRLISRAKFSGMYLWRMTRGFLFLLGGLSDRDVASSILGLYFMYQDKPVVQFAKIFVTAYDYELILNKYATNINKTKKALIKERNEVKRNSKKKFPDVR